MFDNVGNHKVVKFRFPIEDCLEPFWEMLHALNVFQNGYLILEFKDVDVIQSLRATENNFSHIIEDLNNQNPEEESLINSYLEEKKKKVFSMVIDHVAKCIIKNLTPYLDSYLKRSVFLFCYIDGDVYAVINGKSQTLFSEDFQKVWNKLEIVKFLLDLLPNQIKEPQLIQTIAQCYKFPIQFDNLQENIVDISSPIYPKTILNMTGVSFVSIVDPDFVWTNSPLHNSVDSNFNTSTADWGYLVDRETNKHIAICSPNYIWPLTDNLIHFVKEEQKLSYYWENIKKGVYDRVNTKTLKVPYQPTDLVSQFVKCTENSTFTSLLSHLKYNLYLPDNVSFDERKYGRFFSKMIALEDLKQLENYCFYVADTPKHIFVSYKKDKAGIDSLNLMHSIVESDIDKIVDWRGELEHNVVSKHRVSILKPDIAFYYIRLFYESYIHGILRSISLANGFEFVTNQNVEFLQRKNEIDIIAYNGQTIFFVELKTNLSINYIQSYQKKCLLWMQACPEIRDKMEFVIIGFLGKDELQVIDSSFVQRKRMATGTYDFTIKLSDEKFLHCFTESSFRLLQNKLARILRS